MCGSALLSRNRGQTFVSGLSITFSNKLEHTLEYGDQKFSRNDHAKATEGNSSLITAAKAATCQQERQCETAASH